MDKPPIPRRHYEILEYLARNPSQCQTSNEIREAIGFSRRPLQMLRDLRASGLITFDGTEEPGPAMITADGLSTIARHADYFRAVRTAEQVGVQMIEAYHAERRAAEVRDEAEELDDLQGASLQDGHLLSRLQMQVLSSLADQTRGKRWEFVAEVLRRRKAPTRTIDSLVRLELLSERESQSDGCPDWTYRITKAGREALRTGAISPPRPAAPTTATIDQIPRSPRASGFGCFTLVAITIIVLCWLLSCIGQWLNSSL